MIYISVIQINYYIFFVLWICSPFSIQFVIYFLVTLAFFFLWISLSSSFSSSPSASGRYSERRFVDNFSITPSEIWKSGWSALWLPFKLATDTLSLSSSKYISLGSLSPASLGMPSGQRKKCSSWWI